MVQKIRLLMRVVEGGWDWSERSGEMEGDKILKEDYEIMKTDKGDQMIKP